MTGTRMVGSEMVTELPDGTTRWEGPRGSVEYRDRDGRLHRDGGPSVTHAGFQAWHRHGVLHREDGPAASWETGMYGWWRDGKRHRIGGPALRDADGHEEWWVDGRRVPDGTGESFLAAVRAGLARALHRQGVPVR